MVEVMTVTEVAQYLRINPQTVYRRTKAGKLPAVRIGRAIRFRKSELENWLKAAATRQEGLVVPRPLAAATRREEKVAF